MKNGFILFDGAMGTMLQARGLKALSPKHTTSPIPT